MLKSFALTVSLVGAGWAFGYHADTILQPVLEEASAVIQALTSMYSYDPRAATLECLQPGVELNECRSHAQAWLERDGREVVMREIMPQVLGWSANHVEDPAARIMLEGLKKAIEVR